MAGDDELNLSQWAATVALLLVLLVPLALALAAWARSRYVKAVTALQAELATGDTAAPAVQPPPPNPLPLAVRVRPAAQALEAGAPAAAPGRGLRLRVLGVQFVAGLAYWWMLLLCLLVALAYWETLGGTPDQAGTGGGAEGPGALAGHLALWPLLVLPPLLGWAFQAGLPENRVWLCGGLAVLVFGIGVGVLGGSGAAGLLVAAAGALLAAMMTAFLRPAVRGAGPPLVAALSVALVVFSLLMAIGASLDDSDADAPLTAADWASGLLYLAVALGLVGAAAWRVLMRLARRYEARRFSEMQLALGAYWGLLTAYVGVGVLLLAFDERTGSAMEWVGAVILLLWFGWGALERAALWLARRGAPPPAGALLMLRVFKPSARTEAFTDRFLARWRFAGPTWMIAGPDLAGAHMEPDEFFAFVRGRLRERFIVGLGEVPARVQALDDRRDPDGRCRVHELFCSNATWQATVLALMDRAGVVLLDLREYHPGRAGTRFELEAMLQRLPLRRLVVLADAGTDTARLQAALDEAWRKVDPAARPEPGDDTPLTVLTVGSGSTAEMRGLLAACGAAARP